MSTAAQILANRENSTHSTGPTTESGKSTSSLNGLKHGLASGHLIIPGESEEEFTELLAGLIDHHQPANITETMLIQDMAKHHWLADRALRMQNYAIAREGAFPPPPELGLLIHYHTANERAYHRALAAFNSIRKMRLAEIGSASKNASAPKSAPPDPAPAPPPTDPSEPTDEEIVIMFARGFRYNFVTKGYERSQTA